MAEKVTMVLKVDLQCPGCYKKIKKILCKFPQIQDQIYDEKKNTVTIIVVSCSPEKIRDKLCCKGGKTIECIEIKETPKPKPTATPTSTPKPTPTTTPPPQPPPAPPQQTPAPVPKKPLCPAPILVVGCPPMYPVGICCGQCYEGRNDGPCYQGYGRPVPCYDNYGYGPYCYGGNRGCYTSRCDYYSEENTSGCIIM